MSEITPMSVDFGLLKPVDYVGDYANAFRVGRALAQPSAPPAQPGPAPQANAFAPPAPGPGVDPAAAVSAMSGAQRGAAAARAEALAAVFSGLKGASADPQQRLAMARHVAARNPTLGIAPQAIGAGDVSDTALDAHLAQAVSLRVLLQGPTP
ncbi:MAG TPA: hypothetical protein VII63_08565 [Caulobacteraceae bacterium]